MIAHSGREALEGGSGGFTREIQVLLENPTAVPGDPEAANKAAVAAAVPSILSALDSQPTVELGQADRNWLKSALALTGPSPLPSDLPV